MSEKTLRVLLVDDNPADTDSITETLFRSGMPVVAERVNSRATFTQALRDFAPDVVLADRVLADFDAISALDVLHAVRPTKPLIGCGVNPPGEYSSVQRFGTMIDTLHPSSASRT